MKSLAAGLLLLVICLPSGTACAASDWGPWEAPQPGTAARGKDRDLSILRYGIGVFQRYISPVDGPRCPMSPTCSEYALQAIDRHGPLVAVMLTVDRLLHENDPREQKHPVPGSGRLRYHDPLDNNDFWLSTDGD